MNPVDNRGRRTFIKLVQLGFLAACTSAFPRLANGATAWTQRSAPIPPGAQSVGAFQKSCTACQLCVSQCPSKVLRPAFHENGLLGFMQPVLKYGVHHFCDYECRKCIEVCPTLALGEYTLGEKKQIRIGAVQLIVEKCIVLKEQKACGACAEHCPTGALRMVPYKPGLTKPEVVDKDACIGCGGCESICPERKKAVFISRLDIHELASKPKITKQEKIQVLEFGF